MRRPRVFYPTFTRLNEVSSPENLENVELQEAFNVTYDKAGGLSKRFGIEKVNVTPYDTQPINHMINYAGRNQVLVASGTTLRRIDGTTIKTDFANTDFDWAVFTNANLYLVNGVNYYVYDGTIINPVTFHINTPVDMQNTIRRCKYVVQRGQRLFFSGDSQNPGHIYFSEVGDPTFIKATSIIRAVSEDDDEIVGLHEFHDALVVFKNNHIYAWFGWNLITLDDVRFDKLSVHTGSISRNTIRRVHNHLIYAASDGVYALGALEKNVISSENLTDGTIKNRFLNLNIRDKAYAIFNNGLYILSVCNEGTANNICYVLDFKNAAWSIWTGWNANCFMVKDGQVYIGSSLTGQLFKQSILFSDDGLPIHFKIKTKPFYCENPLNLKKFAWFFLTLGEGAESNEVNVTINCDNEEIQIFNGIQLNIIEVAGTNLLDEELPEGRTRLYYKRARMLARALRAQVTIENSEINENIGIYGMGFQFWVIQK